MWKIKLQKIVGNLSGKLRKYDWNSNLEIFSRPQVIENCKQYLLLRTDILQKTVVGCPIDTARLMAAILIFKCTDRGAGVGDYISRGSGPGECCDTVSAKRNVISDEWAREEDRNKYLTARDTTGPGY